MATSDSELDSNSDAIVEDNREEARVSGDATEMKAGISSGDLDLRASESETNARIIGNEGSENGDIARVSEENVADRAMGTESRVLGGNSESNSSSVQFDLENDEFDPEEEMSNEKSDKVEVYSSLLSEFDDFVANEKHGALVATSRALSYGFEVGDLVWGKVKSHPWWPGHIFNEAFASSSVRRTRRDGHVLVAFFGDSSYGWFDPAELIPFDPHFAEKSQQTNSRNFVKAVEEAVDEASRRCGIGLVCKCRNRHNFRPSKEQGYFLVDVPEYEPAGVYSESQIDKARDAFQPVETLAFVKQLASEPAGSDGATIDFIKNKATVFAFRRAVFEKEDMTYAQAFGMQPRPPNESANVAFQPVKEPTRAPLSGPLVIAEALGDGKSSKKHMKVKDQLKKDRYLFKRRDEPSDSKTLDIDQRQGSTSTAAVYSEGLSVVEAGDYVLQKRVMEPYVAVECEHTGFISKEGSGCDEDVSGKEKVNQAPGRLDAPATQGDILDAKPSSEKEMNALQGTKDSTGVDVVGKGLLHIARDGISPSQQENGTMIYGKDEEGAKTPQPKEAEKQTEQRFSAKVEREIGLQKLQDGLPGSHLSSFNAKHSSGMSTDGGMKKPKILKRPAGYMSSGSSTIGEKKKKRKKELGAEKSSDLPKKHLVTGKAGSSGGGSVGKSTQMALSHREDPRVNHQKKDTGAITSSFINSNASLTPSGMVIVGLELPQLLSDLHALALDPFYGLERNSPLNAVQFFLRFRSLVYKKSLVVSPTLETEPVDVRASKPQSGVRASVNSAGERAKEDLMPSKPVKSLVRSDDPTKSGRKRMPSDRQEEMAAKKLKRIDQLKSLAAEKKASQRNLENQRPEGKEFGTVAQAKPIKSSSVKKLEPLTRAIEPTMLVMKFPPQTSLPSVAELKARFARFGSIDLSAIRVFWQSSTCRIVFRHKADAHAAYKYAVGNKSLFGNVNVRYNLREVGSTAPEAPEPEKVRGDETVVEAPRAKDPLIDRPAQSILHQPFSQSRVQPRSILKKSAGDEVGQVNEGNGGKGTPRVKFMLGGEDASRGEQLMVGHRNSFNKSAILADGGAPSSVAMDFNSKNFQKSIPPSSLPILPIPSQFANAPLNNVHPTEVAPRNLPNFDIPSAASSTPSMDISQQMLGLLTRCNDVVTSVTGLLGYLPYHPL